MTTSETIRRVWRETIAGYGAEGVKRDEAVEVALDRLMGLQRRGDLIVDVQRALRAELRRADELDGNSADGMMRRAAEDGLTALFDDDLAIVVTLGGGRRKPWRHVNPVDLGQMRELRYQNVRQAQESYETFAAQSRALEEMIQAAGTVGAAREAVAS